jgi:NAD(P)-dependent dehydrogenase (short-subunit alcohol dehydrogenase family)
MEALSFKDRVVLVTGAASGIGRATALAFADRGARVVAADRDADGNEVTACTIRDQGAEALALTVDVSDAEAVSRMVAHISAKFGRLDVACNNAGIEGELVPTADYTIEEWDRVVGVNLRGVFLCMKHEINLMLASGGGAIVNVASILGVVGFANASAYTAAKHGVLGLTKVAAIEYASKGIRVNAVCPAFIETPMLERAGITSDPQMRETTVNLHPIGRLGTSEEVAAAILWLASTNASFVAGTSLLVDGAYVAR